MTARVIPFPAQFSMPSHWSGHDEYIFGSLRRNGMSIEDAAAEVEMEILDKQPRYPGEDVLFRQAREAFARMVNRKS